MSELKNEYELFIRVLDEEKDISESDPFVVKHIHITENDARGILSVIGRTDLLSEFLTDRFLGKQ